ncbi:MAG: hypothetical protein FJ033_07050 [Chloroflexi bacterium]|nr:hypothetical protein [Chloroflexota bacterium]
MDSGRPTVPGGDGVDLQQTACYTCTRWRSCLVFVTAAGFRVPLCESCLPAIVRGALDASRPAAAGRVPLAAPAR